MNRVRCAVLALLWASCGEGPPALEEGPAGSPEPEAPSAPTREEEREHLAELGYVDYAEEEDTATPGVGAVEPARTYPGYSLYTSLPHGISALIDAEGKEVRRWTLDEGCATTRCALLPDGDVLIVCSTHNRLARLGWDGTPRWKRDIGAHHDVRALPGDEIAVLTYRHRVAPEVSADKPIRDDAVTLLDAAGEVLVSRSIWDMIHATPAHSEHFLKRIFKSESVLNDAFLDLVHANSIDWFQPGPLEAESPIYRAGNVLVAMRTPDVVAIFDLEAGRAVWLWGPRELEGPHEARLLPSGNVLVFDNGYRRSMKSRVVEVDPRTDRIVWEYSSNASRFFSRTRGTAQRLPNGNTLVANSNSGTAFEVDRAGEIVWEFANPHVDGRGRRGAIRIARYELGLVDELRAAFERR